MKIKKQLIWYYISLHFWIKDRFEILYLSWRQLSKGFQKIAHFVMGDIFIISAIDSSPWSVFWKIEAGFFPQIRLWCASGDVLGFWRHQCVCVEGIDTRDSRASSKAKKAPNLFFFLLPPFLLPYDDGLFFSSYSISLFGLSSFMSLDRLHSLRGSGFTISFCMGGNDKIIQGRIG